MSLIIAYAGLYANDDTKSIYQDVRMENTWKVDCRLTWVRLMLHTQLWLKESKLQDSVRSRTDGYVINVNSSYFEWKNGLQMLPSL